MADYLFPDSVSEALFLLAAHPGEALVIAGGTDVMPDILKGKKSPQFLVDITRMPAVNGIECRDGLVTVGAAVTFSALKQHPFIQENVTALAEAAASVGAQGIQNAATWAGNLVQGMPAADGSIVALALEAEVEVADKEGFSWRPAESIFSGPGQSLIDPTRQLITRIRFAVLPTWGTAWQRIGRRASLVLPIVNCAVAVRLGKGVIERATIALGPVARTPFRARKAEEFLAGKAPTLETLKAAGHVAQQESNPRSSIMRASREYRLAIIPVLVRDALQTAVQRAENTGN